MTHHLSRANPGKPSGARIYYVDRRCVGARSAQELVSALIQLHRP